MDTVDVLFSSPLLDWDTHPPAAECVGSWYITVSFSENCLPSVFLFRRDTAVSGPLFWTSRWKPCIEDSRTAGLTLSLRIMTVCL